MEQETTLKSAVDNNDGASTGSKSARSLLPVGLAMVAILLALLACGILAVYYFSGQQQQTDRIALQQQIKVAADEIKAVQQTVTSIQEQQDLQAARLQSYTHRVQALYQDSAMLNEGWRLGETAYLLRLANLNLQWLGDTTAAITLLEIADNTITALDDPTLSSLRATIAQDIAALRAIPALDLIGIVSQLSALSKQIPQLPLIAAQMLVAETPSAESVQEENEESWRHILVKNLQTLQKLVVIRYHEQPIKPLLSPEQREDLMQNLSLLLQQARWAAVQRQQSLYQLNIEQAISWVEDYFDADRAVTKSVLDSLMQLNRIDVNPQLPSLNQSIQQLESIIKERQTSAEADL